MGGDDVFIQVKSNLKRDGLDEGIADKDPNELVPEEPKEEKSIQSMRSISKCSKSVCRYLRYVCR